jgi:hypothetical protein
MSRWFCSLVFQRAQLRIAGFFEDERFLSAKKPLSHQRRARDAVCRVDLSLEEV